MLRALKQMQISPAVHVVEQRHVEVRQVLDRDPLQNYVKEVFVWKSLAESTIIGEVSGRFE
jgi:hypothetical protein